MTGSDKCIRESQCLSFDKYMQLLRGFIDKRHNSLSEQGVNTTIDTIMLSSEDKEIIDSRLNYTKNETFPFEFIINDEDAAQGHGWAAGYGDAADHIMISTLISMKMQLHTESVVVNSCSNSHKMIGDLVINECGNVNHYETYKDNENPEFRLSCAWS